MTIRLVRRLRCISCILFTFLAPVFLYAAIPSAPATGYVSDFAGVLSSEQKSSLENTITLFNASTTNEIAVVTVKSLDGDYIEHYAVELFKAWGIGTKKNNNGVLLLVAVDDHKMRIEVGYGLEGALTDSISAQIIRDDLTPAFKQNDFYGGISLAVNDIIKVTQGEYVADVSSSDATHTGGMSSDSIITLFMFIVIVGANIVSFIASLFARSKSWWAGGVVGGVLGVVFTLGGFFGITLFGGLILTAILAVFGFIFDYVVSNQYTNAVQSGSSIPWWIGGRGFGGGGYSGSSGSSFGGFGGGSSGGGGASGSW